MRSTSILFCGSICIPNYSILLILLLQISIILDEIFKISKAYQIYQSLYQTSYHRHMVLNLPNLNQLFRTTSYPDIFLYTLLWNVGVGGIIVFGLFIIFFITKMCMLRYLKTTKKIQSRESLLTQQSEQQQKNNQPQNQSSNTTINTSQKQSKQQLQKRLSQNARYGVVSFITSIFFYLTLVGIAGIYMAFYAFGRIGFGIGHDILAMAIMASIVIIPTFIWKYATRSNTLMSQSQKNFTAVMLILWLGLSIFLIITTKGVCVCDFDVKYGFTIQDDLKLSTQWTRSLTLDKVCPDGKICHMYATLAENGSDSVFINVHTGTDIQNLTVVIQATPTYNNQMLQIQNNNPQLTISNTNPIKYHNIQYLGRRNIFTFYFSALKSDTLYSVVARDIYNSILYRTNYRTLPNQNAQQLRLVVGGDIGMYEQSLNLTSNLQQYNPHVIILGGDNAYDDAMRTCFYSWDDLYDMLDTLNVKLNRMVPLILTIGNHDVGYDALASVQIDFDNIQQLPYYFLFNPQHKSTNSSINPVPEPKDRKSYHYHILGPTIHAHIDSGYIETYQNQGLFIQKIIKQYPQLYKFVNYHNPVYPTCTDSNQGSNDRDVINNSLKYWTKLFDSGKIVAAFQHHTHYRKFTYKIKDDKVSKNDGVRYVGDGSWGVPENPCPSGHITPRPEYFEHMQNQHPNHVWKIRIFKEEQGYSVEYKVVNVNNTAVFQAVDKLAL